MNYKNQLECLTIQEKIDLLKQLYADLIRNGSTKEKSGICTCGDD